MRLEHNPETHQVVIWAMGPAHVDKVLNALRESWHIQVEVEPVRTSLRETFVRPTNGAGAARQAIRRTRPVRGLHDGDRAAGTRCRVRVHRTRGRRGGAPAVHTVGGEGHPQPAGQGRARRLSAG